MSLLFDETGHFTCSQKRTFSLATDTSELAVTQAQQAERFGNLLILNLFDEVQIG
jgi:hypothetical protein